MRVTHLALRDFRSYAAASVSLGRGITLVHGRNGAGKTNLLEAIYVGCTARSCRTANDREVVRFGARTARVEMRAEGLDGPHEISVGLEPGQPKRVRVDGLAGDRVSGASARPLAAVFLPDRLELVKGRPGLRRAHLDQVVAALWPARAHTRRAYSRALAQRNALLARVRARNAPEGALRTWDLELARHGVGLMADRAAAAGELAARFGPVAADLGLDGDAEVSYRPRSSAQAAEQLAAELHERVEADLERGFTGHGPHRDDLVLRRDGRELRTYGSQGQQRLALLALLLAERDAIGVVRGHPPLLLLDDVMSELDAERRRRLITLVSAAPGGQAVITTTDPEQVPGAGDPSVSRVAVVDGAVLGSSPADRAAAA
jgi:DNA replication and repair protein RecF